MLAPNATPQVPANLRLTVELDALHWNQVLSVLSEGPYRVVSPLIDSISQQLHSTVQTQHAMKGQPRADVLPFGGGQTPTPFIPENS